ncbi:MAG: oligosaccharide flippase family protein [Candidatus Pacebacteria bacterium]|nr:oligosaccharide flippase family protein [Candidatus Paceibacterota bacterium]
MGYTKNALAGFSFQTILKLATYVVVAIKMAVLARVLSPEIFGLFSLVTIALGLTEATTQTGVNLTIVRSKHSVEYFLDSAWVIAIIRGMIIGSLMIVLAFFLSNFFNEPDLLILISLTALVPVIKGFINPYIISMQKNLNFFYDALYRFSYFLAEASFAITVGYLSKSIFALVGALIFAASVELLISFIFFKKRPQFVYRQSRVKEILEGAKWLSFSALLDYLNENLDNFIIGKMTSLHSLGLYHYGYSLSHKVNHDFAKSATHGTLPIYSRLQNSNKRLIKAFYKATASTMVLVILVSLPFLLFPTFVINFLFGSQWLEVTKFLHWLVLAGIVQSFSVLFYSLFMAKKAYFSVNLHLSSSVLTMLILIIIFGSQYGLVGATFAIFLSRLLNIPLLIWRFLKIRNED